jgi:mannose-6-phosphate isomerase
MSIAPGLARRGAASNAEGRDLSSLSRRLDDWLDVSALPLWWSLGADHQWGGYHDCLSLTGRPLAGPRRARVQMRQVYVYAAAGASGWSGPWLQAMEHGLGFFEDRFRRSDGLFRSCVNGRGAPVDDTAMLYDQAFALLGWATGARVTLRPDFEAKAMALLDVIRAERRCPAGGFFESGERANQSNPHMHLLEAALAWIEAGGGPAWETFAREIVDLALSRFVDAERGYVREFFDPQWRAAPGDIGRLVEPGHQFEWAWLLGRWSRLAGDPTALETAIALFQNGVSGVDPQRGVAVDALNDDLQVRSSQARLWPQTERLKAALLLAELDAARRPIYEAHAVAAAQSLLLYLGAPVPGVWRDKLCADGTWKEEPAPASSLYHIACSVWELRRTQTTNVSPRSFRSWGADPVDAREDRVERERPAADGRPGEAGWA